MISPHASTQFLPGKLRILMALGLGIGAVSTIPAADSNATVSLAEREVLRRSQLLGDQVAKLEAADKLLREGQSAAAYKAYEEVFQTIPNIPTAQAFRAVALEGYLRSGLILAREKVNGGDYPAANNILDTLDREGTAKGDRGIVELRQIMNDPDRFPPALTPKHIENVSEVKRLLILAASQEETGMFDKALVTYEDVLRIDPTNSAARRGMEKVERERNRYLKTARDHQRSRMLNGVSELWEDKPVMVSPSVAEMNPATSGMSAARSGKDSIVDKLRDIRIAKVDFSGATLEEVIEYLRVRARDVDPEGKGIDFVIGLPSDVPLPPVSLNLVDVPVEEVLRYATEITGVTYRVEEFAVRIVSMTDTASTLISRTFRVPPDFISTAALAPAAPAATDPFAQQGAGAATTGIQRRMGAKEFLESRGIVFPEGGGANYNPIANMLIVRAPAKSMEMVEALVEQSLNASPKMAVIEVKLMEIGHTKLEEMGFDWLLGGFGTDVNLGGGSGGNQQSTTFGNTEFPVVAGLNKGAMGPVTAGLRSSADLDANRTIENVLYGAVQSTAERSPGTFSLAGVFTDPQFQVVWRGLDQKDGVDLVSKPSVITKSGQKASVEIIREFIYPTEFDPPQIPTNVGGNNNNNNNNNGNNGNNNNSLPPIPVTPTTPTAFEMRRVGMILDVEPVISEDGRSVDLTLTPDFTEFMGFVNYGSPIYSVTTGNLLLGIPATRVELTPNTILQPIFTTKKIVTSVKIYDGATVVLGGLITDQEIMIDDHVPVIGKLPVVGKAFQSKVKQRRLKNMVMFVTVKVVDPSGKRVNQP
jgi:general secretion pathway protein D